MDRHSIIFVTDDRQRHLAELLGNPAGQVDANEPVRTKEVVETADRIILPTPAARAMKSPAFGLIRRFLTPGQKVFGGKLPGELREELAQRRVPYCDLMELDCVQEKNAKVTAEAVVAETIGNSQKAVEEQRILVTGFGRCGRQIAEKLSALGARLVIIARNGEQRQEAELAGYEAADFAGGREMIGDAQTVINTVPAPVITRELYSRMRPDALVLDIASAPGGCDREAAEQYGIRTLALPGLPGRYVTATGAKILAEAIDAETERRGEKTWIFQVLP